LYRNLANGRFEDVSSGAGRVFELMEVGRGAAFGDIDNDGDTDVLVGNAAGRTRLLINESPPAGWLGLRLIGAGGRDMLGARVELQRPGGPTLWRRTRSDGSYASANDPRVLIGLGATSQIGGVRVHWPDGVVEDVRSAPAGRWTTIERGSGR
jgi:hypothetical protein